MTAIMRMTPTVRLTLYALTLACAVLAGCSVIPSLSGGEQPRLVFPSPVNDTSTTFPVTEGTSWIHGTATTVCLDRPGSIEVSSVTPTDGNINVTGWALRPNPALQGRYFVGTRVGTLAENHIRNVTPLTQQCDAEGHSYEVVLQLLGAAETTTTSGWTIHYASADGPDRELSIREGVTMCVLPEGQEGHCPDEASQGQGLRAPVGPAAARGDLRVLERSSSAPSPVAVVDLRTSPVLVLHPVPEQRIVRHPVGGAAVDHDPRCCGLHGFRFLPPGARSSLRLYRI